MRHLSVLKSSSTSLRNGWIERRSPNRPRFASGWHPEIAARSSSRGDRASAGLGLIQIWTASPRALLNANSCLQVLDNHDRAELGAIKNSGPREAALAARILLRLALSRASGHCVEASAWRFVRLESGKLQVGAGLPQIRFSISHSDSLVGVAVSSCFDLGFDIESVDAPISNAVKESFLTHFERRRLARLGTMHSRRCAVRIWTLKEAFSKLVGQGLANDFRELDFRIFPQPVLTSQQDRSSGATHFESLYVEGRDSLYLATLAIAFPAPFVQGEIQFLSLVEEPVDRFDPVLAQPICAT